MPLYFAYGSCMSLSDIRRTEPKATFYGTGRVYNKKLAFTRYSTGRRGGVADIIDSEDNEDFVEGVIFRVPTFRKLDPREGHPYIYKRVPILVQSVDDVNDFVSCDTYEVVHKFMKQYHPSMTYVDLILDGAAGLSEEYQYKLDTILFATDRVKFVPKPEPKRKAAKKGKTFAFEKYDNYFVDDYDATEELRKRMESMY